MNYHLITATELGQSGPRRVRGLAQGAVAAAALVLLCSAARGQSPWQRLQHVVAGRQEQQMATAERPSLAPAPAEAMPMIPVEGAATSSTVHTEITGLAVDENGGAKLDLGKESEDAEIMATDLFKKPEMRQLLGDKPRFVYNPASKADPMLVPWVRNAAIFAELAKLADEAFKAGNMDQAVGFYERIIKLKDPRFTAAATSKLREINSAKAEALAKSAGGGAMMASIELPPWVVDNTTGVINGGGHSLALVGDDMVKVGDPLPRYPEVKVASIVGKKITYTIQGKVFEVELKEPEAK